MYLILNFQRPSYHKIDFRQIIFKLTVFIQLNIMIDVKIYSYASDLRTPLQIISGLTIQVIQEATRMLAACLL